MAETSQKNTTETEEPSEENATQPEEPSKDPSCSIAESSQENPTNSFRFQVHLASKLKQALTSLTDIEFNRQCIGLIEVKAHGLEITARNAESKAAGHLWLKSSGLINFEFSKPMINKKVNLNHILHNLVDAASDDTITVYHLDGSSELTFLFGNASATPRQFAIDLHEMGSGFEKFPNITYPCEAVIHCDDFRQMIQEYQAFDQPRLVTLNITKEKLTLFVATSDWMDDKPTSIRGMEPNQRHHAWFQLAHCESLKKASFMTKGLLLCLLTFPAEQIMLRFNLRELGDLVYTNKVHVMSFNSNCTDDSDDSDDSDEGLSLLVSAASLD